jgi:PKD repeat protein
MIAGSLTTATAQDVTTEGKEFWVSFIGNGFKDRYTNSGQFDFSWVRTQLIISAKRPTHCEIRNPNTAYQDSFTVEANNTYAFDIPIEESYLDVLEYNQVLGRGLLITADDTISVYCANIAEMSFDASYVLPQQALADDYLVQTFDQSEVSNYYSDNYTSAILIIATEDGETTVDITPKVKTLEGRPAGQEFSIVLRKGEVYQIRSNNDDYANRDLSGTRVTSRDCKKIAVFNGNNLTMVPATGGNDSDCVFEQAMPLQAWGKQFVATGSMGRQYNDYVKITSAHDDNNISVNGQPLYTLNTGESKTFELLNQSCFIEAQKSCAVYLYNHSRDPDGWFTNGPGAPSMVWIAPIEQRINQLTFSTFSYESEHNTDIQYQFVNIIINAEDASNVTLDGELIDAAQFENVNGTDEYMYYRKQISHDVHHLTCPGGFNAHIYGYSDSRGYAYMAGSKAADLSTKLVIDGIEVNEGDTITNCSLEPIVFASEVNIGYDEVTWDFGDGTTSHEPIVEHAYAENSFYTASFTVRINETACSQSTTQTTHFFINARLEDDEIHDDETCEGEMYAEFGFEAFIAERDTILIRDIVNTTPSDCNGHLIVNLTVHPQEFESYFDTLCFRGPDTYTDHGFSFHYTQPGHYHDTVVSYTEHGCMRHKYLDLLVPNVIDNDPDIVTGICEPYTWAWNGVTYAHDTIVDDTIENGEGCYSIGHLRLTMGVGAKPKNIKPVEGQTESHWVVVASDFQVNTYEYIITDSVPGMTYETVIWTLEGNCNWRLIPNPTHPERCKVATISYTSDTIWLNATVFGHCFEEGITRSYFLVCSFYGTDENMESAHIEVLPNPNRGEMSLVFSGLEGRVDTKVYDMKGTMVDRFELVNANESRHSYAIGKHPDGVYLFVFNHRGRLFVRKVLITH